MESLAEGYRNYYRRQRQAGEAKVPWWKRLISAILTKCMQACGYVRVKNTAPWRRMGSDLAFDKRTADERKPLYVSEQRIAVYTSLFGSYDILREPLLHPDNIDYYILTDQDIPAGSAWKRLDSSELIPAEYQRYPILCNRWCKMHPHHLFRDYQYSVYIDSNIWVFSDLTPLVAGLDSYPVAMFRHKMRDCVYEEIKACIEQKKDSQEGLEAHLDVIRSHNIPRNWGLLEASVIARKHHDPECISLMDAWWNSFIHNSRRDQVSLIDCLWSRGIQPSEVGTLGDNLRNCNMFFQMSHNGSEVFWQPVDLAGLVKCIESVH